MVFSCPLFCEPELQISCCLISIWSISTFSYFWSLFVYMESFIKSLRINIVPPPIPPADRLQNVSFLTLPWGVEQSFVPSPSHIWIFIIWKCFPSPSLLLPPSWAGSPELSHNSHPWQLYRAYSRYTPARPAYTRELWGILHVVRTS